MNYENICFLTFSKSFGVVFGNSCCFIPAGSTFLYFSGSFIFSGERRAFLCAGAVPTCLSQMGETWAAVTGKGDCDPLCTGPPGGCRVLGRSGTTGAREPAASSHEMMPPGGSKANGQTFGNYCPSDPPLQQQSATFHVALRTGKGMEILPVLDFYFVYLFLSLQSWQ